MSTPGERLREERARLGLSQEQFGAAGGVRKQAQIKYEKGDRSPDSNYFEGIAAAGADVGYILTGQKKSPGQVELDRMSGAMMETSSVAQGLELPRREQELVRDVLFGVAIKNSSLVGQTIENYVAERAAEYKSKPVNPASKNAKGKR